MRLFLCAIVVLFLSPAFAETVEETAEIRAWREFARQVEVAGVDILSTYPQPDTLDKAEGLRYLLQQLSHSIQQKLIGQPEQISLLRIGATTLNKWGFDGADAKYQGASITGSGSYRFYGQLGSARLFALQLTRMEGTYAAYGALTGEHFDTDEEGNFEVLISPRKPSDWTGDWLELDPAADSVLVREYFSDWANERPGRYYLERLDAAVSSAPLTQAQAITLLGDTVAKFSSRAPQWQGRVDQARKHLVNRVYMKKADGQGLASNAYGSGWFSVGEDQALVIEMDAPEALLWSVQLGNVWWESIDYINHTASYNDNQAVPGSDGRYHFVLSHEDPGVPNWLDPAGHSEGALMFRMQEAKKVVNPTMKLVALADLMKHLPKDTPTITFDDRKQAIAMRRAHAAVRWAP